ncbi:MAG: DUF4091 domain-containing protein [Clostridiales bacterium]|nr:DUF4091 domain-containing protein [Clostridiales bacterium]
MQLFLVSSLCKVFLDERPLPDLPADGLSCLWGETLSVQAAWSDPGGAFRTDVRLEVDTPFPGTVRLRQVRHVPVRFPALPDADEGYLRTTPGLYPDILAEAPGIWNAWAGLWETAWIDLTPERGAAPGIYPVTVLLTGMDGARLAEARTQVRVVPAALPEQTLIHTRWLHCDSLCHAYGVDMFSERFFDIAERFIALAVKRGINAVLTPTHTPPLDTAVGGERMTCQLVGIEERDGDYTFDFSLLDRWIDMALRLGAKWFEIPHLFTQWGAEHAPKIMVRRDGRMVRRFGWETDAAGEEYAPFLCRYLGALTRHLDARGLRERTLFHISDEPSKAHLESYRRAHGIVADLLQGFTVIDALSDVAFYKEGLVRHPVAASNRIEPFLAEGVRGLWTYYCVGQYRDVSNQFIALPGARTRIMGAQLYKYDIAGFLHWGYNFYNTQYSRRAIDPYLITDGDGFAPAGDAFVVYPGPGGAPEESMRLMQFAEGLCDLRALRLLEALRGRAFAESALLEGAGAFTFSDYPPASGWLLAMRERVDRAIEEAVT